jgi:hypothetical protein
MIDLFKQLGIPTISIIFLCLAAYLLKEIWTSIKTTRLKVSQDILKKVLDELDQQINEFYLPLKQRLDITLRLYQSTLSWTEDNKRFENSKIGLISEDSRALSKIVNHRMFLPLNLEAEQILLTKTHLKHPEDTTDYGAMLLHFIQWRAFENAVIDGNIESYNGSSFLPFPSEEALKQKKATDYIVKERNSIRASILKLQSASIKLSRNLLKDP